VTDEDDRGQRVLGFRFSLLERLFSWRAPRLLVIYERGFAAGARFVPWTMIRSIERPARGRGGYLIHLDYGGGSIGLPTSSRGARVAAMIEERWMRDGVG
jgi:hypothetical protein